MWQYARDRTVRLPDFLIIGAQKAGTTSLYFDLLKNPAVFMPSDKEPGDLLDDDVYAPPGRAAYAKRFKRARPEQVCGEATTGYTKLPDYAGVADRARRVLGADLKVIYIVREPIARIRSQHHHERFGDRISCGIDEAVRRYSRFVDYSRYTMQITPWIETFGRDQVFILQFESYIADRPTSVDAVSRFLGIDPAGDQVETDVVHNASSGKPVREGPFEIVRNTGIYRNLLRPLLSARARDSLRRFLLPSAPDRAETPSAETVRHIVDELTDDVRQLGEIMGMDTPVWNLGDAGETASSTPPAHPTGTEQ
jgi:hypothetical protein